MHDKKYWLPILFLGTLWGVSVCSGSHAYAEGKQADAAPQSFGYVLQADGLAKTKAEVVELLAKSDRDWIILDAFYGQEEGEGEEGSRWTKTDIKKIRDGKKGRKVLAYFSIGEAEDYRPYWKKSWSKKHPDFVKEENPDWKGNFLVKYWHPQWQKIILKETETILSQQFDGLFFDKVDSFETFEYDPKSDEWIDHRKNKETGKTYRQDMIAFVQEIVTAAKKKSPGCLIVPQNGCQLLEEKSYRGMVTAVGMEDVFDDGEAKQDKESVQYHLKFLKQLSKRQPVLCISYAEKKPLKAFTRKRAAKNGFRLLITDRELTSLGRSP